MSEAGMFSKPDIKKVHRSVNRKIQRIKEYRKSRIADKIEFVAPANNSVFLSLNSKNTVKYISYILKNHQDDAETKFYCVNVTYLAATCSDDD